MQLLFIYLNTDLSLLAAKKNWNVKPLLIFFFIWFLLIYLEDNPISR